MSNQWITDTVDMMNEITRLRAENEALRERQNGFVHLDDLRKAMCDCADENAKLRVENEALRLIRCSDSRMHKWNGDGQCRHCCNYATDLIDKALHGEVE